MDPVMSFHKTRRLRYALLIITLTFILLQSGCNDRSAENFENIVNVCGVVRNEASYIELAVDHTYNMDEPEGSYLDSAIVMLFNSDFSDTFLGQWFFYDYRVYGIQVSAGETYNLMVAAEGYDTLYGQTTVPGDYQILSPLPGDTITVDDTIVYTIGHGTKDYQIWCYYYTGEWNEGLVYGFPNFSKDSIMKIPLAVLSEFIEPLDTNIVCTFEIAGYDSNYYNYHYFYDSDDPPQCGVKGGIGLFGSAWVRSVDVYLKVN